MLKFQKPTIKKSLEIFDEIFLKVLAVNRQNSHIPGSWPMISTTIDPNVWHALPISVIKFKVSTTNSCQKSLPILKKKIRLK